MKESQFRQVVLSRTPCRLDCTLFWQTEIKSRRKNLIFSTILEMVKISLNLLLKSCSRIGGGGKKLKCLTRQNCGQALAITFEMCLILIAAFYRRNGARQIHLIFSPESWWGKKNNKIVVRANVRGKSWNWESMSDCSEWSGK